MKTAVEEYHEWVWNKFFSEVADLIQEDLMKDIVNKELVDNVMAQINQYNAQVTYGVMTTEAVEEYRRKMVTSIVKLCLDKIL